VAFLFCYWTRSFFFLPKMKRFRNEGGGRGSTLPSFHRSPSYFDLVSNLEGCFRMVVPYEYVPHTHPSTIAIVIHSGGCNHTSLDSPAALKTTETVANKPVQMPVNHDVPLAVEQSANVALATSRQTQSPNGIKSFRNFFFLSLCFGCSLCHHVTGFSMKITDLEIVAEQLGYSPTNFVKVTSRNKKGTPIAIQTYPLYGGAPRRQNKAQRSVSNPSLWLGTPFPTLYWLTCPDISRCIADLEREGYVKTMEQELQNCMVMAECLRLAHQDYAIQRWHSLMDDDRKQIVTLSWESPTAERVRLMLECSGIAGSNVTASQMPPVKCLHTHYAHYRSQAKTSTTSLNPVGVRVHELLGEIFPELVL
jgi:hypothetical protein